MRAILFLASLLILPLAALLFAQWPLREVVQPARAWPTTWRRSSLPSTRPWPSRPLRARGTHLAAGRPAPAHAPQRWRAAALLVCVGPWSLFMLWAAFPTVRDAALGLERFSETLSPGYFIIKLALALMLALVLADALMQAWPRKGRKP